MKSLSSNSARLLQEIALPRGSGSTAHTKNLEAIDRTKMKELLYYNYIAIQDIS